MRCCWRYEQAAAGFRFRISSRPPERRLYHPAAKGSHLIMRRDNPFAQTVVPDHCQIDRGTLRAILRQSGITSDELTKFL